MVTKLKKTSNCVLCVVTLWQFGGSNQLETLSQSPCRYLTAAVRDMLGDCQWPLINGGNFHQSHETKMRQSQPIFRQANQRRVMPTNWKPWASYQIRKIAGCACTGNAGNVFPATDYKGNRYFAIPCVTHVPWCMSGLPTRGGGENISRHSRRMRNPQFY